MKLKHQTILRLLAVILMTAGLFGGNHRAYAIDGDGSQGNPYKIGSTADWESFVSSVNSGNSYENKYLELSSDISVGNIRITSGSNVQFGGHFDCKGHTLNINYTSGGPYSSPFYYVVGASIKNLRVTGTIVANEKFAAGIAGFCNNTTISNCVVSVTIDSEVNGEGDHGGIVGKTRGVTIDNCLFNGKLLGPNTNSCGGFVGGYGDSHDVCTIKNSFFSPLEITMSETGSATFSRCPLYQGYVPHSFYTRTFGTTPTYQQQGAEASDNPLSVAQLLNVSNPGVDGYPEPWEVNEGGNVAYLKLFNTSVDVTGWMAGTAGTSSTNPLLNIMGGSGVKYEYKVYSAGDATYTTTAPTSAGHYYVRATSPDGFVSRRDFYVYDPPTVISPLTYNGSPQKLVNYTNTDGGLFYFSHGTLLDDNPKETQAGTYTIQYCVKGKTGYNDIGSYDPWIPVGSLTATIDPKPLGSDAISLETTTCTFDGNPKTPTVIVNDGNYQLDSGDYNVSYSNNINAGTATVTVTEKTGKNYAVNGTATFTIDPKSLTSPTIEIPATTYTGSTLKPTVTVKDGSTVIDPSEYTVTYDDQHVNVGDVPEVTISDNPGGNYTVSGVGTFTILKAAPTYTAPQAKDLTYNMGVQELITAGSTSHGTFYYSTDGTNFSPSTSALIGTEAKDYPTYYKLIGDANHTDVGNGTDSPYIYLPVTIKPKPLTSPEILLSTEVFYYDGTAKTPTVTVRDGGTVIPTSEYTVEFKDNVNAGKATVTLKDNPNGNYVVSGTTYFSIVPQQPGVTPPTPMSNLIYNTAQQNLVMAGNVVGGTMEYSLDNKNYSTNIPKGQDAKQYEVYYRVKGDENHSDRDPVLLFVTINPKTVSNPAINLNPSSFTYDGQAKEPKVTVKDGEIVVPESEYTVGFSNNTNVGTAMVTITDKAGGNYMVNGSTTFVILSAVSGITPPTAKTDLVYNGKAQELILPGKAEGGTLYYGLSRSNYSAEPPTGIDAKKYTVYYKVVGDSNHDDSELGSVDVTIAPKTLSDPEIILTPSSFIYDGTAKEPTVMVKDGDAVVSASEYTIEYSNNISAGKATVTLKDNEGGNYIVNGSIDFNINTDAPGITPPTAMTGLIYNTKAQQLVTAGSVVGGTMEYSLDNKNYSTKIPTGTDAGQYEVYYRVKGDENHSDRDPVSLKVTISPKTVSSPVITLSATSFIYNGEEQRPDVTVKDGEVLVPASEYTVDYSNNINVGTAMVIIMDKKDGNYIVNGTTSFTILAANAGVTPPKAKTNLVYNGTAQQLIIAGSVEGGTMDYSLDRNNYSTEIPTGVDAKDYKVYYRVKGDINHGDETDGSLTVTISPKTMDNPDIILEPASFIFDGTEKKPAVTVKDGEAEVPASEYTVTYSDNTNVGTGLVTLTDNEGGNYIISGTAEFSIIAAVTGVTFPEVKTGLVYNRTAQELVTPGSAVGGTMEYSLNNKKYSTKIPTGTDAKQYTVYFRVVGDDNHVSMEPMSLIATINSKALTDPTIELNPSQFAYDGKEKKPKVTVKDGENVVPASEYTVSYSDNIAIGTATVTITDNSGGNYIVSAMTTFQIYDPNTGFVAPVAISGLVYNGKAQELVTAGVAIDGVMKYSLNNKDFSTVIPTGTDAGSYKVYYKVVNEVSGIDTNAGYLTVSISEKSVVLSVSLTGAPESVPSITVTDAEGNLMPSDSYIVVITTATGLPVTPVGNRLEVGDYVLTVKPTGNYTGPSVSMSFHVRRAYSFVFTMKSDLIGVCLPYNRDVPNGYHVYYFDRVGEDGYPVFKRILADKLIGGEPYLLKYVGSSSAREGTRGGSTLDLSPSNLGLIDMSIQIKSQTNQNMVFTGTFDDMTNTKALSEGAYLLQADNTWRPLDSSMASNGDAICLEAFQTYLRFKDRTTPYPYMTVTMVAANGDNPDPPSAIDALILEDEEGHLEWYDMQGRRIEVPQKGVNILRTEDGKMRKVLVRDKR